MPGSFVFSQNIPVPKGWKDLESFNIDLTKELEKLHLSKKQPFCDSSHRSTKYKPIVLTAEKSETIYFCGCKYTKNPPFCDGTHSSL